MGEEKPVNKRVTVAERMRALLPPEQCTLRHQRILGSKAAHLAKAHGIAPERRLEGATEVNAWPQAFLDDILRRIRGETPDTGVQCPYCDAVELTPLEDGQVLCEHCGRQHDERRL